MAAKVSLLDPGNLRDFCPTKNLENNRTMELDVCEIDTYLFQSNSCFVERKMKAKRKT